MRVRLYAVSGLINTVDGGMQLPAMPSVNFNGPPSVNFIGVRKLSQPITGFEIEGRGEDGFDANILTNVVDTVHEPPHGSSLQK